eukprot:3554039-Prymnesium_polylepis.1
MSRPSTHSLARATVDRVVACIAATSNERSALARRWHTTLQSSRTRRASIAPGLPRNKAQYRKN